MTGGSPGSKARHLRSSGNWLVAAVLRSPAHRLLSGSTLILTVHGRRTGLARTLPVQYAREGSQLVLLPGNPERKRWWRNLVGGAPVTVLLASQVRTCQAELVHPGSANFDAAATAYGRRFPRAAASARAAPVLVVATLQP